MGFFDYASSVEATKRAREKTKAKSGYFSFDPDEVDTDANPNDVMRQAMFHQLMVDNSPVAASTVAGLAAGTLLQKGVKKLFGKKKEATPAESAPNLDAQIQDSLARRVEELTSTGKVGYPEALYQAATEISSKRGELPYAGAPYSPDAVDDATRLPRMQAASSLAKQAKELGYSPPSGGESGGYGNFSVNGEKVYLPRAKAAELSATGAKVMALGEGDAVDSPYKIGQKYEWEDRGFKYSGPIVGYDARGLPLVEIDGKIVRPSGKESTTSRVMQDTVAGWTAPGAGEISGIRDNLDKEVKFGLEGLRNSDNLLKAIKANPESIGTPGGVLSFVNNVRATAVALGKSFANPEDQNNVLDPRLYQNELKELEGSPLFKSLRAKGVQADYIKGLFIAQAYLVAKVDEGSGKGISDNDVKLRFGQIGAHASDPLAAAKLIEEQQGRTYWRLKHTIASASARLTKKGDPEDQFVTFQKEALAPWAGRFDDNVWVPSSSGGAKKRSKETRDFLESLK